MRPMTKSECIAHIRALTNEVKTTWASTQAQESRFELIEANVQDEFNYLNPLPETAEWINYRIVLLSFMAHGSSMEENFLTIPTTSETHDDKDLIINEYAKTHALLTDDDREFFLNRNYSDEWGRYQGLHLNRMGNSYHRYRASQTTFFAPRNNDGETPEPNTQESPRRP